MSIDLRKVSDTQRSYFKDSVMELKEDKYTNKEVSDELGISAQAVSRYYLKYIKGGSAGLEAKRRGRKKNEVKKLSICDERFIIGKIIGRMPEEYNEKRFWTRQNIQCLIEKELNICMSIASVSNYLVSWGFVNKRSISIEENICSTISKTWMREKYHNIEICARNENAEILWVHNFDRISLPVNLIKKTKQQNRWKVKCYQMEIIASYGKKVFMLSSSRYNGNELIKFFENLICYSNKKIYLMLNIEKLHPMEPVKKWLGKNKDSIEVYYVPQ